MAWVESLSESFSARHESAHARQAGEVLEDLEEFRESLSSLFEVIPVEIAVVMHARSIALSLAHPWLPLARRVAAPASRRYFAGWFAEHEIHVLAPSALERRASAVPGSQRGAAAHAAPRVRASRARRQQPGPPAPVLDRALPPVRALGMALRGRRRLARRARPRCSVPRSCAGCARAGAPSSRPRPSDAMLLGGTLFSMLEEERGVHVAAALATSPLERGARGLIAEAFDRRWPRSSATGATTWTRSRRRNRVGP